MEIATSGGGDAVTPATIECPFCAEQIQARAKKCRHCGETVDVTLRRAEEALRASERQSGPVYMNAGVMGGAPAYAPPYGESKSRVLAVVLALLLGGLGAHKFYLGRIGQGILYFIFCWTFIPALLGLLEAIVYALSSDDSFHRRYG